MSGLERTAIPRNVLDRLLDVERRLDDLEGFAALPVVDPESGEGDVTYVSIVQEVEIGEGPGIDIAGTSPTQTVGLGLDLPLLSHGDGSPAEEYATLALALAAAGAGDSIWLPPGEYAGDHTISAGVAVVGLARDTVILTGSITGASGGRIANLSIVRNANDANTLTALTGPSSGVFDVMGCAITCTQTGTGDVRAVVAGAGTVNISRSDIYAWGQGSGWAYALYAAASGGVIYARHCVLRATSNEAENNPIYQAGLSSIDTFPVDSVTSGYTAGAVNMTLGQRYIVAVAGDYAYFPPTSTDMKRDGHWETVDDWANYRAPLGTGGIALGNLIEFSDATRPNPIDPAYNAAHTYHWYRTGDGSPASLRVFDDNYPDNVGSVTVTVYEFSYVYTYSCRMIAVEGEFESESGDRSAWDVGIYDERHASDIANSTLRRHLPAPGTNRNVAVDDGARWVSRALTEADISNLDHTDPDALHDNVEGEIHAIADKAAPVDADELVIEDSEADWAKKRVALSALPAGASALDDLTDVNAPAPNDEDVLTWDDGAGEWVAAAASGGASAFTDLTDTPADYTDDGGKYARVNSGETALEFVDLPETAYAETIGDGIDDTFDIVHNLDSTDVIVQVWDLDATPVTLFEPDSIHVIDADTVRVVFASAPDEDQMRVVVVIGGGESSGDSTYTDAYASRPAASNAGDLFMPSDGFVIERDTGAAWAPWGPIFPMASPDLGDFTWINQGTATADDTNGGIYVLAPAVAGDQLRILKKAAPSTPYTITAALLLHRYAVDYASSGLVFRQSSDGKLVGYTPVSNAAGLMDLIKFNSPTSYNSSYGSVVASALGFGVVWLRIADDGSNRTAAWSTDGQHFHQFHSVGRTDFLTADEVGFYVSSNNATWPAALTLLSWEES